MSASVNYAAEHAAILEDSDTEDVRVDVNQRALIDKILARYCTDFSVYRELLQNSNDARATRSEIRFTTVQRNDQKLVASVSYRNNGAPFSDGDWSRLTCIASGNPNPDSIGAFGVGSYSLFAISENPMVCSGGSALVFKWKGDALYTKRSRRGSGADDVWTSFIMPARDPYSVPDTVEFGSFLANSLTFTSSLSGVQVFVDDVELLSVSKVMKKPVVMVPPVENSWWKRNALVTSSPSGLFSLATQDGALTETEVSITSRIAGDATRSATLSARVIAAEVNTKVDPVLLQRMERVTKKKPMKKFSLRVVLPASNDDSPEGSGNQRQQRVARSVLSDFAPRLGAGRIFIGFRTQQTTGVAAHVQAPFLPTVEREALDLVDPALAQWNGELLYVSGVTLRLALEHVMLSRIGRLWIAEAPARAKAEERRLEHISSLVSASVANEAVVDSKPDLVDKPTSSGRAVSSAQSSALEKKGPRSLLGGFASFMSQAATEVRRIAVSVSETVASDPSNLLEFADPQPLSRAEREAIILMRSFEPARSAPDSRIGTAIANGFEGCLPGMAAPVLTTAGVVRGSACFANLGMEGFFSFDMGQGSSPLVRSVVLSNANDYVRHVCRIGPVSISVLAAHLKTRVISEDEALLIFLWMHQYGRRNPQEVASFPSLKDSMSVAFSRPDSSQAVSPSRLREFKYHVAGFPSAVVPFPFGTLPFKFCSRLPNRVVRDKSFSSCFEPLSWNVWASYVCDHQCLTAARSDEADALRLSVFSALAGGFRDRSETAYSTVSMLRQKLGPRKCLPTDGGGLERPGDTYLRIAELGMFSGVGIAIVSDDLYAARNVTKEFLVAIGCREAVSLEVLFSELESKKWNENPRGMVRYLASVKHKLSQDEWQRLRATEFLPSSADAELHRPPELSLPVKELHDLKSLPFVRWEGRLEPGSEEGDLLCRYLGVSEVPDLDFLIGIAADTKTSADVRSRCIWFCASRLDRSRDYRDQLQRNASVARRQFFPCSRYNPLVAGDEIERGLCKPSECYTDRICGKLGFWTVEGEFELAALRFNVSREPTSSEYTKSLLDLIRRIKSMDATDESRRAIVWSWFELLSSRVGQLAESDKASIRRAEIVPVWRSAQRPGHLAWRRTCDVYSSTIASGVAGSLFDVVPRNDFLLSVGMREEPSLLDICALIVEDPNAVYVRIGDPKRYEELLHRVSAQFTELPGTVVRRLRSSPFLLANRLSEGDLEQHLGDEEEEAPTGERTDDSIAVQKVTYSLAHASDIFLVDDALLQRMFNPLVAPLNSGLEKFYESLGSMYLSNAVTRQSEVASGRHVCKETALSRELADRILQRSGLIIETASRPLVRSARNCMTANTFAVREVRSISAIFTLGNIRRIQSISCCSGVSLVGTKPLARPPLPSSTKLVLYCTAELDFFDVADSLGRVLFDRCGLNDVFLLAQLLEVSLGQLRARGFPVDKIVQAEAPRPQEETSHTPADVPGHAHQVEQPRPERPPGADAPEHKSNGGGYQDIIMAMFPDADARWVGAQLRMDPTETGLRALKDRMQRGDYPKATGRVRSSETLPQPPSSQGPQPTSSKPNLTKSLLKAFKKRTGSSLGGTSGLGDALGTAGGAGSSQTQNPTDPGPDFHGDRSPDDAKAEEFTRSTLSSAVRASAPVPAAGVTSPSQTVTPHQPPALDASSCEAIPGQNLYPVPREGRQRSKTSHGFRVFVSRLDEDHEVSVRFVLENWAIVERFSFLLAELASVFDLDRKALAVFYATTGRTIAFNANGSLHFNLRYFANLHNGTSDSRPSREACIFWYT